jgi:two-component system, chemotaxis family, protein-glutamate methylesterase/glutaminase
MSSRNVRVLVVDDSPLVREIISDVIKDSPGIELAGTACDGRQALVQLERLKPDVVTLDVQMPNMDGLATLDAILASNPVPVVMVSSLTQLGANTTLDALDRGAVDYVAKPEGAAEIKTMLGGELMRKIRLMAGTDVPRMLQIRKERAARAGVIRQRQVEAAPPGATGDATDFADTCIAIGISTGGPPALSALFEELRPPLPPVVVVQHMPPAFTKPFAWRLNSISQLSVKEAAAGDVLKPNQVFVAPGGQHLHLRRKAGQVVVEIHDGEPVSGHRPSVDVMMGCAAEIFGNRCLGVVMTGMGRDGSDGCGAIRSRGGYVLGQDEASSDVYGMNKVAFVEGNVDRQFSLDNAAAAITQQARKLRCGTPVGAA